MNLVLRCALSLVALLSLSHSAVAAEHSVFVHLEGASAVEVDLASRAGAAPAAVPAGSPSQRRIAEIRAAQAAIEPAIVAAGGRIIGRYAKLANAIAVRAPVESLETLRTLPGVRSVELVHHYQRLLESSVPFIGATAVWGTRSTNATGLGVRVGIIDSGIDYNHADFGGSGRPADFANNDPTLVEIGSFPTAKVAGGYDFVGDDFDSTGKQGSPLAVPDFDPLDPAPNGHGSHVASTVAGFGVLTNGITYNGTYGPSLSMSQFLVAPGVAPQATLYALKVFGNGGSTSGNIILSALEWALDPNDDGNFSDHLDVVNLSLGGVFEVAATNSGEGSGVDLLSQRGCVVVVSAGNSGNTRFVVGLPAAVDRAITVANSIDNGAAYSTIKITAPVVIAGDYASTEGEFTAKLEKVGPITAAVAYANPPAACSAILNPADLKGKIALIDRGSCFFVDKIRRAQQAGAIGVIMVNNIDGPPIVMGGQGDTSDIKIPGVMIRQDDGALLKSQLQNGLTVTLAAFAAVARPELADQLENSSSRGPRLPDAHLKPDLAAPGTSINAAAAGGGTTGKLLTGTSMSSPHVAGAAALLHQLHPTWTPDDIKSALMNTAIATHTEKGVAYPESRVGAGRIRVDHAAATTALARADTNDGTVSLSFGALQLASRYSSTRVIRVFNLAAAPQTFDVSVSNTVARSGVTLTPLATRLTVPARGSSTVTVRFDADPTQFNLDDDGTTSGVIGDKARHRLLEASGQVWFTSPSQAIHVPWYSSVRALSDYHVTATQIGLPVTGQSTFAIATRGNSAHRQPIVGIFQLGGTDASSNFPDDRASGDLLAFGAASDITTAGSINSATVYFAVAVAGYWPTPQRPFQSIRFEIDRNGDGRVDYSVLNSTGGSVLLGDIDDVQQMNDAFISVVRDESKSTANLTTGPAFNLLDPTFRDTASFFNSAAVLGAPASALGLTTGVTSFRYRVIVERTQGTFADQSQTSAWVSFDAAHPAVDGTAAGLRHTPYFDEGLSPVVSIDRNAAVAAGFNASKPLRALVLHQHNAAGSQADIVTLDLGTPDTDGDGRPDVDEMNQFGDLTSNGSGDQDGDGVSDANEVLAGSDPRDPASLFRASLPSKPGSTLSWSSVAGRTYTVERSAVAQGPYTPIKSGIAATPPLNDFKDPEANAGAHYYRVRVE